MGDISLTNGEELWLKEHLSQIEKRMMLRIGAG